MKNGEIFGHIPRALASTKQGTGTVCHFLKKSECTGDVRIVGKAVNQGGGNGMEVPCVYRFMGPEKYVQRLKSLLDIDNNLSVRYTSQTEEAIKHKRAHNEDASSSRTKKSKR